MFQVFSKFMTQWQKSHALAFEKRTRLQGKRHVLETEERVLDSPSVKRRMGQGPCGVREELSKIENVEDNDDLETGIKSETTSHREREVRTLMKSNQTYSRAAKVASIRNFDK